MSQEVYFEAQDKETSLCGQHAINNLLQGAYFTAIDLGRIGSHLDEQESNLYTIEEEEEKFDPIQTSNNIEIEAPTVTSFTNQNRDRTYSNVSMTGLFSVEVLISALKQIHIDALPLSHPKCFAANEHPDKEQGYIFYCRSHWIAYRKINNIWYNLNSQSNYLLLDPQPVRITDFFLSAQISKLQDEGFQVFVIRGDFPTAGRLAPRTNDLQGTYCWYQSADIKSHVELDKESRQKQKEEQHLRTQELMRTDPRQYNALMMNGYNVRNNEPHVDINALSLYEQQQQYLAMQQIQAQQYYDNDDNKTKTSNPFSKLKKIYHEKTKELQEVAEVFKTRMSIGNKDDNNIANDYLQQLEKAKQASLKTQPAEIDLQAMNTPQVAVVSQNEDKTRNDEIGGVRKEDQDVDLALALSASMAQDANVNEKKIHNDAVQLEFEMTDHKAKIIRNDFLDLMSMSDDNMTQEVDMELDEDDPFSSLIREYSSANKQNQATNTNVVNENQAANDLNLLDFDPMNSTNNDSTTQGVDFDNLFSDLNSNTHGDQETNDLLELMTPKNDNILQQHNPLLSPNDNGNNVKSSASTAFEYDDKSGQSMAQRMEDDLWRILERSLTNSYN